MRKEFLRNIEGPNKKEQARTSEVHGYRELANTALDDADKIAADLDKRIAMAALTRATSKETQRTVFDLQVKKQQIMRELREQLRQLDDAEYVPEKPVKSRFISYKDGKFFRFGDNATSMTFGEILTGADWGVDFFLDPATVPREHRKRYIVESAKRKIHQLLNEQIIAEESTSRLTHEGRRDAYRRLKQDNEQGLDVKRAGSLAEKMVRNLLKRFMYDFQVDYEVVDTDVHQDVEHKIDFIVRVRDRQRGVGVNKDRAAASKGIQFTIQTSQKYSQERRTARTREAPGTRRGARCSSCHHTTRRPQ